MYTITPAIAGVFFRPSTKAANAKIPAQGRNFRLSKKPDIGNGYSPSEDSRSKIGDMCGDFRAILLAKSLPYANERPGGTLVARPVSECKTRKSAFMHFFDTQKFRHEAGISASCIVCGCKSGHLRLCKLPDYAALTPWLAAFLEGLQTIDFADALTKNPGPLPEFLLYPYIA